MRKTLLIPIVAFLVGVVSLSPIRMVNLVSASPGVVNITLYASFQKGWGYTPTTITIPGPTITVYQGDLVDLTLISTDAIIHNFFVDYDGDMYVSPGEPTSPDFTTTINYQFTADTLGTFEYFCEYHVPTMRGTFIVAAPTPVPEFPLGLIIEIVFIPVIIYLWYKGKRRSPIKQLGTYVRDVINSLM